MPDPEKLKGRVGLIYNVVEAMVLLLSLGVGTYCARTIIEHEKQLVRVETSVGIHAERIDRIETRGTSSLDSHSKQDDQRDSETRSRLDKLENAVISLQTAPGKLEAIGVEVRGLKEGQNRIERLLEEHMKERKL